MYAFNNNYPVVFAEHRKPFRFDYFEPEVDLSCLKIPGAVKSLTTFEQEKTVGIPKNILWERLLFLLSLDSKAPLSNLCKSIRCGEQSLSCFNEYSKIAEIKFQTCHYFGDEGARGIVSQKTLAEKEYICYDWVAFNRGGKHNIDYIKTNDPFVNEIWFYSSDRIDGNTPVKDACAVSIVTEKQMLDFDYSETMARFKLVHEMESRGMKGKFNGYTAKGTPRHYKFRTTSIARTKHQRANEIESQSKNIEIPKISEEGLLQDLQQGRMDSNRFLRWL
tara:strand:- start:251 stop:1081 length:831 start_codon:yes stop_codon:yes gene_type:complete